MAESLEREIARLEASTASAGIAAELARVREGLSECADVRPFRLEELRIASPCKERWAGMVGDDRVRVCNGCERPVFDLSELTRAQANAVLATRGITPCVRLRRRLDGTVITADCPPSAQPGGGRLAMVAGAVAAGAALLGAKPASAEPEIAAEISATTGGIEGVVKDAASGTAVVGAAVVAGEYVAITDVHGRYRVTALPPGDYTIAIDYRETTTELHDVRVEAGVATRVNAEIEMPVAKYTIPIGGYFVTMGVPSQRDGIGVAFSEPEPEPEPEPDVVPPAPPPPHRPRIEWSSWTRAGVGLERDAPAGIARVIGPPPDDRHAAWEAALGADLTIPVARLRLGAWVEARTSSGPVLGVDVRLEDLVVRGGANLDVVTGAIVYGERVRLVASGNRSLDEPRDWSATFGLEFDPIRALRRLLGR